ncbi:bifunctional phosphoribosyl-AMP cyclohydrolase/phosphoribosyl-ATP diphosphatase HisIE [Myroides odoratimimus]|uniref:bifunctional phosphoribosyl-AMP cyclohydrolase/phosphoribosyl-ATP diphosphatase HisIE n=1 Tax=Myroides odoratimimus TaxID=76832 RepID=UPI001CE08216|nr:bifunctional phosphoribosyl-AMP cyclohydrolase/phosphoribosyl-ATP diphosphatase HisIE [Myroides odoratimimus]MCA4793538.1 bifunctional phosphoribosyl-AMP cyclohydrolase/phosphoribosyl-ATP diphosphatase HisIE [Myroides odoratimimus]MCA4820719.1 bifunctional phosphoribosyl-AMP cyclohydrolase/phosphoribosyl-ATP diphosphatase HisIE [Myroides odoratimimus]MCO7722678.1 bifunctional phosphoribosyl-AMP cyclohydrolase/phosphoribosyl-ATP diphosphatase HisIE [Myroides odoratimimus]MDM1059628.1 bifuncti
MKLDIDFNKGNGLVPVIIQDKDSMQVLMQGFMNEEAYQQTITEGKVTFYSRTKNRLWTKGETSGHYLFVKEILTDCDRDCLLIQVEAIGATCHTGSTSCFGEIGDKGFVYTLENIISERIDNNVESSYTNQLFKRGINKVAQKVGEEAVELVIEAKDDNDTLFKNEAADLLYHYLILLKAKGFTLSDIESVLKERHLK